MNVLMSEMLSRFFKTGPGQYGEGDRFLGIKVPLTRAVVKDCWRETDFADLEACISSGNHELRLAAPLRHREVSRQRAPRVSAEMTSPLACA